MSKFLVAIFATAAMFAIPKTDAAMRQRAGAAYQPDEANFAAIEAWNASGVYERAIALMGRQIDGG